ncbi:hypothetical protein [Streptomyces cylindrosporus]|uniref:Carboxylic ester hydrolase n=1 Tax=Streptomyces cylindrosporus TaxID=2927583 RepID=A0ABS9YGL9_9ACTN|nr:hypothetical protein [Streptomyces cylindrosporus]MCI3276363.1 hypothetical protein [Streptomyces cylindrosporus]
MLPQQSSANNASSCFDWFQSGDVGGDPARVYVTGLSAGGGIVAGLAYGCVQAAGSPWVCMYVGATQTAKQWGDRVRAARPGYTVPWPALTVFQGSADYTVKPVNMTDLMKQWTDVQGTDQTADVSDPGSGTAQCGTAGVYILDVNLCAAYRLGLTSG